MKHVIWRLGLIAFLLVLASCSQHVVLSEDFPTPVMRKIATPVTLYLPPELVNYTHTEKPDPGVNWTIEFGASNARLFEAVVRGMFDKVTVAYTLDEVSDDATVLKPVMKQYQFSTPGMSKTDYYEVWIKYALQLYHPKNTGLMDWPFTAYGRDEPDGKSTAATMREASRRAMRDAAAAVVLGFTKQPAVVSHFKLPTGSKTAGKP